MKKFVLVIGCARSGTSMVGAIVDSHPNMLRAHESSASRALWQGRSRNDILDEIRANSASYGASNRPSEGYEYAIESEPKQEIHVFADKVWNPALLNLSATIKQIAEIMEAPVALVHCTRNPFDVIATMHRRSGAPLRDRARFYFMHCDAAQMLYDRGHTPVEIANHELIADPSTVSARLFDGLEFPASASHLDRIAARVSKKLSRTREQVEWPSGLVTEISERAAQYAFLRGHSFND